MCACVKIFLISDLAKSYPPCMRIIVKETNLAKLKVGCLFLVTYIGGSLGREGDHSVLIPDVNISKVQSLFPSSCILIFDSFASIIISISE